MKYFFLVCLLLSFILSLFLFIITNAKIKKIEKTYKDKQSNNHIFLKHFFNREVGLKEKQSQLRKRQDKKTMKIIFTEDNKAYWIDNNIFFVADVVDGKPDFLNSKQVETENMSKDELDKMLFILDNLRKGDKDERGNSRQ